MLSILVSCTSLSWFSTLTQLYVITRTHMRLQLTSFQNQNTWNKIKINFFSVRSGLIDYLWWVEHKLINIWSSHELTVCCHTVESIPLMYTKRKVQYKREKKQILNLLGKLPSLPCCHHWESYPYTTVLQRQRTHVKLHFRELNLNQVQKEIPWPWSPIFTYWGQLKGHSYSNRRMAPRGL